MPLSGETTAQLLRVLSQRRLEFGRVSERAQEKPVETKKAWGGLVQVKLARSMRHSVVQWLPFFFGGCPTKMVFPKKVPFFSRVTEQLRSWLLGWIVGL